MDCITRTMNYHRLLRQYKYSISGSDSTMSPSQDHLTKVTSINNELIKEEKYLLEKCPNLFSFMRKIHNY